MTVSPDYILFAQHGWADDNRAMLDLTQRLVSPDEAVHVVAPSLNYVQTWLRIEPLIAAVEQQAAAAIAQYPHTPLRIIGHSMGGLIWLELLHRYPNRWPQVESLVLLASPIGGADLGRLLDPMGLGIGIAADLGINRRPLAEAIAAQIPTLVIAGNIDNGSDGTITVESTKVAQAQFVTLEGVSHPQIRNHLATADLIRQFWAGETVGTPLSPHPIIQKLRQVPGMTDAHPRDFAKAKIIATLEDQSTLRIWQNAWGILHIFLGSPEGDCLYAGFVGWLHKDKAQRLLGELEVLRESAF